MMVLVWAFVGHLVWDSASWTCMSIFFTKVGKFSFIIFQIDFQFFVLSLLLLAPLWCECGTSWSCSRGCLYYPLFFGLFFSSCCFDWLFFASLWPKSLIWFSASFSLLFVPCRFFSLSFLKNFIYLFFLERGRKGERERNINVWPSLTLPLLRAQAATQACTLTGNWTGECLFLKPLLSPLSYTS